MASSYCSRVITSLINQSLLQPDTLAPTAHLLVYCSRRGNLLASGSCAQHPGLAHRDRLSQLSSCRSYVLLRRLQRARLLNEFLNNRLKFPHTDTAFVSPLVLMLT